MLVAEHSVWVLHPKRTLSGWKHRNEADGPAEVEWSLDPSRSPRLVGRWVERSENTNA